MEDTAKQIAEFSSGPDVRLKHKLIQAATDIEEVLKAYEHLAIRVFIFGMAVYGLIHAALH
jgi:hypothetical protein